jgi:DNA repair protein RAD57
LVAPTEIAKECKITLTEAQNIINLVCKPYVCQPRSLADIQHEHDEVFTTGDTTLDAALGGGIRTGMLWEVVGQRCESQCHFCVTTLIYNRSSAAGKTQWGLQLSLTVQLPKIMGGLSGSACYLTTSATLPTNRLAELSRVHPLLSPSLCGLSDVQTLSTTNIPLLLHVLSVLFPKLIADHSKPPAKPIKLLVIDALAELFHSSDKTTTQTLVQRSRNIYEISSLLHSLASRYRIAILVLNEVSDAFDRGYNADASSDLIYNDQSRWFGRADSVPGENRKEASLGLVWANQVNVRIMLSRTGRRRYLDEVRFAGNKLQKVDSDTAAGSHVEAMEENATLIRRMSVIFSSVAPPLSLDYIVTVEGISVLSDVSVPHEIQQTMPSAPQPPAATSIAMTSVLADISDPEALSQVSPLDVGCAEDEGAGEVLQVDEWDAYWEQNEEDAYNAVDLDSLLPGNITKTRC